MSNRKARLDLMGSHGAGDPAPNETLGLIAFSRWVGPDNRIQAAPHNRTRRPVRVGLSMQAIDDAVRRPQFEPVALQAGVDPWQIFDHLAQHPPDRQTT